MIWLQLRLHVRTQSTNGTWKSRRFRPCRLRIVLELSYKFRFSNLHTTVIIMKRFLATLDSRARRLNNTLGDRELGRIADYMYEWEGRIAEELELKIAEVAGIKTKHPKELELQT